MLATHIGWIYTLLERVNKCRLEEGEIQRDVDLLSLNKACIFVRVCWAMQTEICAFRHFGDGGWCNKAEFSRKPPSWSLKWQCSRVMLSARSHAPIQVVTVESNALQDLACSAQLWLHKSTLSEPPTMILFLISRICRVCTRVQLHEHFYFIVHMNKWLWFLFLLRFMFISNY